LVARANAWRGRIVAGTIVATYFVVLLVRGGHRAWGHFGVWALSPKFLDTRSVTSAWECARKGAAVLPVNPCDPLRRPANYPSIWLLPSHLGLGVGSTNALGWAIGVCFFIAALFVLPREASTSLGLVFGFALCSPAVMLGVERGNADLLVFAVLVVGLVALRRSIRGPLFIFFAAVLKLFPIFAATALLRLPRSQARYAVPAVGIAFGAYVVATLGTVRQILHVVPQTPAYSYGVKIFGGWAANVSAAYQLHLSTTAWDVIVIGLAVALATALRRRVRRNMRIDDACTAGPRELDCFVAGSAVYACTFALLENWDYRLAFLLLAIPQLFTWARSGRLLGMIGLGLVMASLWLTAPWNGVPFVHWATDRWDWLTRQRPLVGADLGLSAGASAQLLLAIVLVVLAAAALPALRLPLQSIRRRPQPVEA
jgi:Glycosyltransferase family 87